MALQPASITKGGQLTNPMVRSTNAASAPEVSGIDAPMDFFPRALGASYQVVIDPGSGVAANTYASAEFRQSYRLANDAATDDAIITVPQAGSGAARIDYLIFRVYDTQYAGQADPTGKGCGLELVPSLPAGYPYIAICKITQPAGNTAGIQQSMIADLRDIASPRWHMVKRSLPSLPGDAGMVLNNQADGEWWPNANGPQDIKIPTWASQAIVECEWLAVQCPANANPWGNIWVEFGPAASGNHREKSTQKFQFNATLSADAKNLDLKVSDTVVIPKGYRGTTQRFIPFGAYASGYNPSAGKLTLTTFSGMVMTVTFLEVADSSATV